MGRACSNSASTRRREALSFNWAQKLSLALLKQVAKKQATNLQSAQKTLQQAENKPEQPDTTAQDLLATTKKRQKLADELQMVEKQVLPLSLQESEVKASA